MINMGQGQGRVLPIGELGNNKICVTHQTKSKSDETTQSMESLD